MIPDLGDKILECHVYLRKKKRRMLQMPEGEAFECSVPFCFLRHCERENILG